MRTWLPVGWNWIAVAIAGCCLAFSQTAWKFEVASVKPAGGGPSGPSTAIDPGMVSFRNTNLRNLLMRAYVLRNYQIQGPGWIDTERYDLDAKVPEGAPLDQVPAMLRDLLTARFQLVTRRETKEENVYVLTVGRNGPKLAKSQTVMRPGPDSAPNLMANQIELNAGRLSVPGVTMAHFANTLAGLVGHPVLDETGIEGVFDVNLNVQMSEIAAIRAGPAADAMQASEPTNTLAAAIKELGLNWGTRKAPIERLVVESAVRVPLGN
ncbi:MAG: TIGR03435 family protein [Bryobacteraceae bacterium]|jgi:uncharacterized protein (TIGR03435 family)